MRSILLCFALFDFRFPSLSLSLPLFAYANPCNYYNSVEHFYGREIKNTCGNICVLIARKKERAGEGEQQRGKRKGSVCTVGAHQRLSSPLAPPAINKHSLAGAVPVVVVALPLFLSLTHSLDCIADN